MLSIHGKSHHYQIVIASISFKKLQNKNFTNPKTVKEFPSL